MDLETDDTVSFNNGSHNSIQARKSKKQQISLTIQPELLLKLDALANTTGQSRASLINIAVYNIVENGLAINKSQ